jgi:hypothetical protein
MHIVMEFISSGVYFVLSIIGKSSIVKRTLVFLAWHVFKTIEGIQLGVLRRTRDCALGIRSVLV